MKLHLAIAALCAVPAFAQVTTTAVPRLADQYEGNDLARYPFGRTGFRTQMLITSGAIAANNALITGLEFRADTSNSIGSQATTIPNVTIELSTTTRTVASMQTDFASNVTGMVTQSFSGTVSLPAHSSNPPAAAQWSRINFTTPFGFAIGQDNLLIDITAADVNSTTTNYVLDSWLPGGTVVNYGTPGQLSQPDGVRLTVAGNGGNQGRMSAIVPGGSIAILAQSQFNPWSGFLILGVQRFPQPIDLTPFGAPGSSLYVDLLDSYPFTLQQPPIGFGYRFSWALNIPNSPNVQGQSLQMQPAVNDPPANALGVVLGSAVELAIGDPLPHPMRQVNSSDFTAAQGRFQYVSGIYGGAVVRLVGSFQ